DTEQRLEREREAGEDERVLDGLAEDVVAEDLPVVGEPDELAGRADPVVGEAEINRHPERIGDETGEQHERGQDEAVAEDVLLLPPLSEPLEAATPAAQPGRLQGALRDGHATRP